MILPIRNIILLVLMLASAGLAVAMRPTNKIADQGPKVELETMIPRAFGGWKEELQPATQIIDPQQKEMLQKIYTQTLSRTFVDELGNRVMLSIAYGEDQRDSVQLHYPEVCYPAQGFVVLSNEIGVLETDSGNILVKRLLTKLGGRVEPVTYWTTLGDQLVQGGLNTKLTQLKFGFKRQIPDGLLFRVSSINQDTESAYAMQQDFVRALITSLSEKDRLKLTGLPANAGQK